MNKDFEEWEKQTFVEMSQSGHITSINNKELSSDIELVKIAFEAGQKAEQDRNKWISVEENLPTEKDDTEYIPNLKTVNVFVSDGKHRGIGCFDLKEKCFIDPCDYLEDVELENIIAWQQLPKV